MNQGSAPLLSVNRARPDAECPSGGGVDESYLLIEERAVVAETRSS
jgi:hypothetical protein